MASEPTVTTLGEISDDVAYGYTESASEKKVGPRFLRITDIQNGVVNWSTVPFCPISESDHEKYRLHAGDIVVARTGNSTGENFLFRGGADSVFASYLIRFRVDQRRADPAYVWYNLRTKRWWSYVHGSKTGSAQAGANAKVLGNFQLNLPPLPEQKAVSRILETLDEKIELNRRLNATLEAMARSLFQSWFVDFDPVHAKAAGRQPSGMGAAAALFASSFQDSALGDIPDGWHVGKISDLTSFSRAALSPGDFAGETFDHYSLPAFDEGRTPKSETGAEIKSNKLIVDPDTVLLSKLNPHIPRIWLPELSPVRRSVCSTEFLVARASAPFSREYLFALFTSNRFSTAYSTLVTGTTGSHQRIKAEAVLNLDTLIPPEPVIAAFTAFARPLFARINRNIAESRTLAAVRDTLLPKLLSGELYASPIRHAQ